MIQHMHVNSRELSAALSQTHEAEFEFTAQGWRVSYDDENPHLLAVAILFNRQLPWEKTNEHGERPGDICCQRATGRFCYEHDPANWVEINGQWINRARE